MCHLPTGAGDEVPDDNANGTSVSRTDDVKFIFLLNFSAQSLF